ncbi:nucleoside hydrolase [Clostridium neuense]|uniref:Nucleoside hydrolase n=1 Tax=Clostridium neuense TaxID=1728934 RepID=A0ABW8TK73_9CLOT
MRIPIVIDTDPGIDDAVAILMAFAAENLDIKAITTVVGNVELEKTTVNALKLVEFSGLNIKVASGAEKHIRREHFSAEWYHGASGLGNLKFPDPHIKVCDKNAYDTIYEEACKYSGELRLVCLGPLTNIASTILIYPDIVDKIHSITIMGGAINGGNDTPAAEFNMYADPEAARIVFESKVPVTMIGLDVTNRALLYKDDIDEIGRGNNKMAKLVAKLATKIYENCKALKVEGAAMHDPFAMGYVIDNSIMKYKSFHVDVETSSDLTRGKTIVDVNNLLNKPANVNVGIDLDRDKFVSMLKKLFI